MTTTTLRRRADGLAIASFLCSLFWLGGLGSFAGIVLGRVHRHYAREDGMKPSGLATAGIILGVIGVIGMIIFIQALTSSPDPAQQYITCIQNTGGPC